MTKVVKLAICSVFVCLVVSCGSSSTEENQTNIPNKARSSSSKTEQQAATSSKSELDAKMKVVTSEKDYSALLSASRWFASHQKASLPKLVQLLTNSKFVGLKDSADLIIWDRIENGDLKSYGHGHVVDDDLFVVAGRASWILKEITGQKMGLVNMTTGDSAKLAVQEKWAEYLRGRSSKAAGKGTER